MDLTKITIKEARAKIDSGELQISDLIASALKAISEKNGELNAVIEVFDDIDRQVAQAEEMQKSGRATDLTGIPIVIKDNICFDGHKVSSCSNILEGYEATYDSTAVKRLLEAGAVIIGRANMDDSAMGSSTETSPFGPSKNPYDTSRVPGGSSGGPAVAVASGMALASLGSDTGGSIRQPAGFCGVVGLKPTYGSVSRHGLLALSSSLDVIGPFGKNASDANIVYSIVAGDDDYDQTSIQDLQSKFVNKKVKKIGVPRSFIDCDGLDTETKENFEKTLEKLKNAGFEVVDIEVPLMELSLAVYYIIQPAEASSNLARYDGIRFGLSIPKGTVEESYKEVKTKGFGKEVKRRILLGTYVLSHGYYDAYYGKAVALQSAITKEIERAFEQVDIIATPTTPTPAFKFGSKSDPVSMYLSDIFTVPANISGMPAISVPNGFNSEGLPLDIQFMGPKLGDKMLLDLAETFEGLK